MKTQSNVERFYEWMKMINNKFLYDNSMMVNAFNIVSLQDINDIEVIEWEIVKPD